MPNPADATAQLLFRVSDSDTAVALGSGDVEVLATPRAIAWAEAATCAAVSEFLPSDDTTVGTAVQVEHLLPSEVGSVVSATARVSRISGRRVVFAVELVNDRGDVVLAGTITRVVVARERFTPAAAD
ncbi:MAG: thioesterase [Actinomycetia bacterium]|nr:thioesterase [Actinomycetes bacterium]MCH9801332.1 thioesterase [Actinomycetes bacterium]